MTFKVKHTSSKIRYPNPTRPKKAKFKDPYRFYVYMWLRSKDSVTGKIGTPYYVGKGQTKRAYRKEGPEDKSNVIIVESGLLEEDAFELEIELISQYGRVDIGTGILRNKTDGGEGGSGYRHTEDFKINLSKLKKGIPATYEQTAERKNNISIALTGIKHSLETREKLRIAKTGKKHSPEHIENNRKAHLGKKHELIVCPHCGTIGGNSTMTRNHFDNCKYTIQKIYNTLTEISNKYQITPIQRINDHLIKTKSILIFHQMISHISDSPTLFPNLSRELP